MKDLISRQEAIRKYCADECRYEPEGCNGTEDCSCVRLLKSLPSVQSEPKWIPCSERLPDLLDERYLVSLAWGGVGTMEYKSTGFHNYGSFSPVPIETVTAWMPLPEPYGKKEWTE